jgi:hypothetical protein
LDRRIRVFVVVLKFLEHLVGMEISSSVILMQPGMYILRQPKDGRAPLSVSRAPALAGSVNNSGKMEVMGTPKTDGSVLRDGGDCLILHVFAGPVEILVSALVQKSGQLPAIRVDKIALDEAGAVIADPAKPIEIAPQGISVIGHVELRGDLVATPGATLGDPIGPNRLEGFQVMWPDRPEGVDLAYSIVVEGVGAMPATKTGNFCGTRGEARRITEVTFALIGPNAGQYQLEGAAHFSGGFQLPIASGMPLGGPSGVEHLTALALRAAPRSVGKAANPWDESARTKVFKAKPGVSAPAQAKAAPATVKPAAKAVAGKVVENGKNTGGAVKKAVSRTATTK